jgi:hypothetical protein
MRLIELREKLQAESVEKTPATPTLPVKQTHSNDLPEPVEDTRELAPNTGVVANPWPDVPDREPEAETAPDNGLPSVGL